MAVKEVGNGWEDGWNFGIDETEKISFHGATPTVQRSGSAQAAAPAGGTGATEGAYDTANNRDAMIALVNEMRAVLVEKGLMKGSA